MMSNPDFDEGHTILASIPAMPRLRPATIPALHPVPEYRAEGERKRRYEDMKAVLQTPWIGVVTMAYAHYETFFGVLWDGVRELCASRAFVEACLHLRTFAEAEAVKLAPPPMADRLAAAGYAVREIDEIRDVIEVFSRGNFSYLLLATLARHLLEGGEFGADASAEPISARRAPASHSALVLMEPHHAGPDIRACYEDLKTRLGLPFVNTDYRALARWPSYFTSAWADLRPVAGTQLHESVTQAIHDRAMQLAASLPNVAGLTSRALRRAAEMDASLPEVLEVARLFQWLLPGLVANVAFFRLQLDLQRTVSGADARFGGLSR